MEVLKKLGSICPDKNKHDTNVALLLKERCILCRMILTSSFLKECIYHKKDNIALFILLIETATNLLIVKFELTDINSNAVIISGFVCVMVFYPNPKWCHCCSI